jgi:hypothetical protein
MRMCPNCGKRINPPAFCAKCGAFVDVETPELSARSVAASAAEGSVATLTEALTYVPSGHVAVRAEVNEVHVEPLPQLPYRFGVFWAVLRIILGCGEVIAGLVSLATLNGLAFMLIVVGSLDVATGVGLFAKKRVALIAMFGLMGLGFLGQLISNPITALIAGIFIYCPIMYYYYKRSDEFE